MGSQQFIQHEILPSLLLLAIQLAFLNKLCIEMSGRALSEGPSH